MTAVFSRCPDGEFPKRGTWRPVTSDGKRTAAFCCPDCDFKAALATHEIDVNGNVSPSVVCDGEGCSFHEHITLEGWTP